MYRRSRSASAAPGVRSLAFSVLSGHTPTLPGADVSMHAQHLTTPLVGVQATNFQHSEPPPAQGSHQPRELSLREALRLQSPDMPCTTPIHRDLISGGVDGEGRASSVSVELRPHCPSPAYTPEKDERGGGGLELSNSACYRQPQHDEDIGSHRHTHSVANGNTGVARGRTTSPGRAAPREHPKHKFGQSKTDWYTYQQRMLDSKADTEKSSNRRMQAGHESVLSTRNVPAVSPGKRRACRSTSPAKKTANSGQSRSISPAMPSDASCNALVPWHSPGKGSELLGRSGMCRQIFLVLYCARKCRC